MIIGLSEVFGILWVKITLQCRVGSIKKEKNRIKLAGFRTVSSYPEENLYLSLESGKCSSYTDHQCNKKGYVGKLERDYTLFISIKQIRKD